MLNFRTNAPAWEIEIALRAQKRFAWAPLLLPLLDGTDVAVIVHSTWRKRFDDTMFKNFLPQEIAERLICLDGQIQGRETLSSDEYIAQAVDIINPKSLCVVDDRPAFFETGHVSSWLAKNHGQFVWCNADVGVLDVGVREQIRSWAQHGNGSKS